MCDYSGNDFGANYPDACCIDGYLWDLDSCEEPGGPLYKGGDTPCPQCNHAEWLSHLEEGVINDGYAAFHDNKTEADTPKARFLEDQEQIAAWWLQGFREARASAGAVAA